MIAAPTVRHPSSFHIAAWVIIGLALLLALSMHFLTALLAGLLVYELIRTLTPVIQKYSRSDSGSLIAVVFLSVVVIGLLILLLFSIASFFQNGPESLGALQEKLLSVIDQTRAQLPNWLIAYFPANIEDVQNGLTSWFKAHRTTLQLVSKEAIEVLIHLIIGMVLGAMIALHAAHSHRITQPLALALLRRVALLADVFHRIVFAQIKISLLNTILTTIFLVVVLPFLGVSLPLKKTMILVTFLTGLLPVVGNLISNAVIVVISLSISLYVALASLAFLVIIHKLEYFMNAKIVGSQINARSWELLITMLIMESIFNLPGLVAAPVYYAYVKSELHQVGWI